MICENVRINWSLLIILVRSIHYEALNPNGANMNSF